MSDVKQPLAGQWWITNGGDDIVFICGFDPEGCPVLNNLDGEIYAKLLRYFLQEYHHMPDCTGFDWVPVQPPVVEVWPKWYVLGLNLGFPFEPWYLKRTSEKECLRWGTKYDGVTVGFESQSWVGQSDTWIEVTEAEALARVTPPVDPCEGYEILPNGTMLRSGDQCQRVYTDEWVDTLYPGRTIGVETGCPGPYRRRVAPATVTPGNCSPGTFTITTVESPDDWVTQDRVPARAGIDERRYRDAGGWADAAIINWPTPERAVHGAKINGDTLLLRCRRKDLPPVPVVQPSVKKVHGHLYSHHSAAREGVVSAVMFSRDRLTSGGYVELLPSPDGGWCIEVQP